MKLHTKLFLALVAGIALGAALHSQADSGWINAVNVNVLRPIGQIFLRLIFMIVVPMVFSALVIGVYELGRGHDLKGVAGRTLWFTLVMSALSVVIGMVLVNVLRPGDGLDLQRSAVAPQPGGVQALQANAAAVTPVTETLVELIPRNPFDSAVRALDGEMLPLMVFALIFGMAVSVAVPKDQEKNVLVRLLEQVFDACMTIVHFVMKLAPVAVFAIIFNTAFTFGTAVFASLFFYVVTVVVGLLLHQFGVYAALLKLSARRSPIEFFATAGRCICTRSRRPHPTPRCHFHSRWPRRSLACRPTSPGSSSRWVRRPIRMARRSSRASPCSFWRRCTVSIYPLASKLA